MTAARLPVADPTKLSTLVERDNSLPDQPTREQLVLAPLLEAALHGPVREMLARPGKEFRARVCQQAFALAGGDGNPLPPELPLAIEVLHAGSLIVDDIEDGSEERRGAPALHRLFGTPVALNAGNWLYFYPHRLLARSGLSARARLEASDRMGDCLLRCHEGQALDLTLRASALPQADLPTIVNAVSERKTGALMGLAAAFGGIAAGADRTQLDALDRFGRGLGVGLQMLDDLSGVLNPSRRDKGAEDLLHDRATWTWACLAADVEAETFEALRQYRAAVADEDDGGNQAVMMDELLRQLRFWLAVSGMRRARRRLEASVAELDDGLADDNARAAIMAEVTRLERGFMEGTP